MGIIEQLGIFALLVELHVKEIVMMAESISQSQWMMQRKELSMIART